METNTKERHLISNRETLERAYGKDHQIWKLLSVSLLLVLLMCLAFTFFGARVDREKFTTEVTPIHIELNPITSRNKTAQNPHNLQL
jgi:hypothetical protein